MEVKRRMEVVELINSYLFIYFSLMDFVLPGEPVLSERKDHTMQDAFGTLRSTRAYNTDDVSCDSDDGNKTTVTPTTTSKLPEIGQVVIASVTRITTKWVGLDIRAIVPAFEGQDGASKLSPPPLPPKDPIPLAEPFKGTMRAMDIWGQKLSAHEAAAKTTSRPLNNPLAAATMEGKLYLSVRPGDLIRAKIIGVGDASAGFMLSISPEEEGTAVALGVIFARCKGSGGEPMHPISWCEMECPVTFIKETRRVCIGRVGVAGDGVVGSVGVGVGGSTTASPNSSSITSTTTTSMQQQS